jgi:hypothetical protein
MCNCQKTKSLENAKISGQIIEKVLENANLSPFLELCLELTAYLRMFRSHRLLIECVVFFIEGPSLDTEF